MSFFFLTTGNRSSPLPTTLMKEFLVLNHDVKQTMGKEIITKMMIFWKSKRFFFKGSSSLSQFFFFLFLLFFLYLPKYALFLSLLLLFLVMLKITKTTGKTIFLRNLLCYVVRYHSDGENRKKHSLKTFYN